jgi:hypothetical protein
MDEKTDAILIIPQGFPSMQLVEIDPTIHGKHEKLEKQLSTSCCPGSNAEVTCLLQHIITIQSFDEGDTLVSTRDFHGLVHQEMFNKIKIGLAVLILLHRLGCRSPA